jgi:putative endonuclease
MVRTNDATTTDIGQRAELIAAQYLRDNGYRIIQRNWRRPECEVDVIAYKDKVMHFVEVKYRRTDGAGSGLEYVTTAKLRHMNYAARRWISEYVWRGQYVLSAIEVQGGDYRVTAFIESIEA